MHDFPADEHKDDVLRLEPERPSLKRLVLDRLRTAIVTLHFDESTRLVERDLAGRMGVSRTVLREALNHLEAEGLLEWRANHGFVVRKIDRERAEAIYEVRASLEGMAARLFVERASEEDVAALREAVEAMEHAFDAGDTHEVLRATDQFYEALLTGARNEVLTEFLQSLKAQVTYLRAASMSADERRPAAVAEVKAILNAISEGDADTVERLSIEHVRRAAQAALKVFSMRNK